MAGGKKKIEVHISAKTHIGSFLAASSADMEKLIFKDHFVSILFFPSHNLRTTSLIIDFEMSYLAVTNIF